MFGVIVGRGQIKLLTLGGKTLRHLRHDLAVPDPHSRIDDQRRLGADHDADSGKALDRPGMGGNPRKIVGRNHVAAGLCLSH